MPDDPMGSDKTITTKTFEEAAKAMNQTVEEAKQNTLRQLKKELESKE